MEVTPVSVETQKGEKGLCRCWRKAENKDKNSLLHVEEKTKEMVYEEVTDQNSSGSVDEKQPHTMSWNQTLIWTLKIFRLPLL